eukprot:TRINITY_DN67450_c5_g1_i1.p1 TRINITY_DN67450_c5_g1~~TRINITY_DN67450_c5_g1_i1.p1  ORF type:complete len:476 (+),score=28.16 TRINITY_DN67450_c5_g1_i1:50-1477(+)
MSLVWCFNLCSVLGLVALVFLGIFAGIMRLRRKQRTIAFFHPYCNAGGGGERVLWLAVQALLESCPTYTVYVYTGDAASSAEILKKAQDAFGVTFGYNEPKFVHLRLRNCVEASRYPFFTMAGQSFGSVILGLEALLRFTPEVYIDSMGYAFTLPLFSCFGGCKIGCYVHYPTISTDMLEAVTTRGEAHNNRKLIAKYGILRKFKLFYYKLFAFTYGWAGRYSEQIMVNSSWTNGHIISLWKKPAKTHILYPPCDVTERLKMQLEPRKPVVLSIAQFRPEKDHPKQIRILEALFKKYPQWKDQGVRLIMCGGARNQGDYERVEKLKIQAKTAGLEQFVEIKDNIPYPQLLQWTQDAMIGIHTMWNEHFGIGVVELLAGGVLTIAHNSAGPQQDIIKAPYSEAGDNSGATGFLAETDEQYADAIHCILSLKDEQKKRIQQNARQSTTRFTDKGFQERWLNLVKPLLGANAFCHKPT